MIGAILKLFATLLALAICAATAVVVYSSLGSGFLSGRLLPNGWDQPVSDTPQPPQVFTVQPGASANTIGDELQQRALIRSSMAFRWKIESRGIGGRIPAGDYELSPSMSVDQIVDAFRTARAVPVSALDPGGVRDDPVSRSSVPRREPPLLAPAPTVSYLFRWHHQ